jgi:hypothetical protein
MTPELYPHTDNEYSKEDRQQCALVEGMNNCLNLHLGHESGNFFSSLSDDNRWI